MARVTGTTEGRAPLTAATIFRFFAPLQATWLMMAAEGPFVAAIIARLPDPVPNLAAYGIALAIGFVTEAPIIMMMSASNALVRDAVSYRRLRNFSTAMNVGVPLLVGTVLVGPVFRGLTDDLLALPPEVAGLARSALFLLLPWPAAIGYRRFCHGILISSGRTRLVAYGTGIRLATMAATGLVLHASGTVPGAVVGTAALSAGVVAEAIAARLWVRADVRRLRATPPSAEAPPPTRREILDFYLPLALTPLINMAAQPLITFFLGRGRMPIESLAVMPVLGSFGFLFRCSAQAYQDVVIALAPRGPDAPAALRRFAVGLGATMSGAMALVVLTPLGRFWFGEVAHLVPALLALALPAALLLVPTPALSTAVCFQQARLVSRRRTRVLTAGTVVEVATIASVLSLGISRSGFPAVFVAVAAILAGRIAATTFLLLVAAPGAEAAPPGDAVR